MHTNDKKNNYQTIRTTVISAIAVTAAVLFTIMTGSLAMADSSTPPSLHTTYSGYTVATNGIQVPMFLNINSEDLNGNLVAGVSYQTGASYSCTGAIGSNYHLTLSCYDNANRSLFLEGWASVQNSSIQGTDGAGGSWVVA